MTDLTKTIAELRRLDAEATPGEWVECRDDTDPPSWEHLVEARDADGICDDVAHNVRGTDAVLIAAMRNALPALLDAAERVAQLDRPDSVVMLELRGDLKRADALLAYGEPEVGAPGPLPDKVDEAVRVVEGVLDVVDGVCKRLAELEQAQTWIPVGERLPESPSGDGPPGHYWILEPDGSGPWNAFYCGDGEWFCLIPDGKACGVKVGRWTSALVPPLPDPPTSKEPTR